MMTNVKEPGQILGLAKNFLVRSCLTEAGAWEISWGEGPGRCYYQVPSELAVLLMTCNAAGSRETWVDRLADGLQTDAAEAEVLVDTFAKEGLLDAEGAVLTPGEAQWLDVGWSDALQLHWAERNYRWEHDYTGNPKVMARYDGQNVQPTTPPPGPFPCVPQGEALVLPDPVELDMSFGQAQRQRRTSYNCFRGTSVSLTEVSTILRWTLKAKWSDGVAPMRVTQSYSRGEPFVGFVAFGDNPPDGCLPRTVYQYDPASNVLAPRAGTVPQKWSELLWGQHFADGAAMGLILAANWEHFMWKYRLPRAYRWVYTECGSFMQTALTVATALRLRCWQTPALDDVKFNQLLGYDEAALSPTYLALFGRLNSDAG